MPRETETPHGSTFSLPPLPEALTVLQTAKMNPCRQLARIQEDQGEEHTPGLWYSTQQAEEASTALLTDPRTEDVNTKC